MTITSNLAAVFDDLLAPAKVVTHKVYTKARWSDPWTEEPYLNCNYAVFCISPDTGAAELNWTYGKTKRFDLPEWITVQPDDGSRRYVKVEYSSEFNYIGGEFRQLVWYGIVNGVATRQGGIQTREDGTYFESGVQTISCVGLEKIFDDTIVRNSAWYDYEDETVYFTDRGLTFNDHRADHTPGGNMTADNSDGDPVFSGKVLDDDAFWSTKTILQYLANRHSPEDKNGVSLIPFRVSDEALRLLGTWKDRPCLPTHGRTVRELLNQLLTNERMMSWRLDVVAADDGEPDRIELMICPWIGDTLSLPSGDVLLPSSRRWSIYAEKSRGEIMSVLSHEYAVDRVRIQGRRATTTFTISYDDDSLEKGWSAALEAAYRTAATMLPAYIAMTDDADALVQKRTLNQQARDIERLKPVYSRFKSPDGWDFTTKDGLGNGDPHSIFPAIKDAKDFKHSKRDFFFNHSLSLRDGYDYKVISSTGGTPFPSTKDSIGPFNERPSLVAIKFPDKEGVPVDKYVEINKVHDGSRKDRQPEEPNRSWSAGVRAPRHDRALMVTVEGEPQHVIASGDFTPLTEVDEDFTTYIDPPQTYTESATEPNLGAWNWRDMLCTVSVDLQTHCEGVFPQFPALPETDWVREVLLVAPETFRLDWLVPQTVIGVDLEGKLVRCALGGWINDDRKKLEDRARMAYQWYGIERRSIEWSSTQISGAILPGDYVVKFGEKVTRVVNSVITSMRVSSPLGSDESAAPMPTISYRTDFVRDFNLYLDSTARPSHHAERIG